MREEKKPKLASTGHIKHQAHPIVEVVTQGRACFERAGQAGAEGELLVRTNAEAFDACKADLAGTS